MSLTSPVSCLSCTFSSYLFFLFDLLDLVSFDELDFLNNESDYDGSGSRSPGSCAFIFFYIKYVGSAGESVGSVSGIDSHNFFPTGIESVGDVVSLLVFVPRGVESKGGRLIESFWCPKY